MNPSVGFVGISDLDRDGQLDLWFDSRQGDIWVLRTNQLRYAGWSLIPADLTGAVPLDVADYDGDGVPDVLWRSSNGALSIGAGARQWLVAAGVLLRAAATKRGRAAHAARFRRSRRSSRRRDPAAGHELGQQCDRLDARPS